MPVTLGRWTGATTTLVPSDLNWAAPSGLFPTQERNDSSAYTFASSTSTLTLPATGLADGYLIVAAFEFEDTSNGRFTPQGQVVQSSGTGTVISTPAGGFARDTSEDRAYVRCWTFVDSPSASAEFQFQWKRDNDTATGGTVRSEFVVIPLYYADFGAYESASTQLANTTTPERVTGFSGTDGTNITLSGDVVTLSGANKRYLVLNGFFTEGRGGRTQRWHGLRVDGVQENASRAYAYYRDGNNDETGNLSSWIVETAGTSVTVDQYTYLGDGVADGEGGADAGGSTPAFGDYGFVVLELHDTAEVFVSKNTAEQNIATTGVTDIAVSPTAGVVAADSASFTRSSDLGMSAAAAMDMLFGFNMSAASESIGSGSRFTAFSELTINSVEQTNTVHGNYLRNNQGSQDTFGWSANSISFTSLSQNDVVGVSVTELPGSEGGGGDVRTQVGWAGFWGINLDTMQATGGTEITGSGSTTTSSVTSAGTGTVVGNVSGSGSTTTSSVTSAGTGTVTETGGGGGQPVSGTTGSPTITSGVTYNGETGSTYQWSGSGSITFSGASTAYYLIVAGGGGGGKNNFGGAGGGGAGGLLGGLTGSTFSATASTYTITVGAGGAGAAGTVVADGANGGNSSITGTNAPAVAIGGGGGAAETDGITGGSGGGGGFESANGGAATSGQGNAGGRGFVDSGGGGGAGTAGGEGTGSAAGAGGNGVASSITGSSVTYAGGGGGGAALFVSGVGGAGGTGGGGAGGNGGTNSGVAGTDGLGGGGGGAGGDNVANAQVGGDGGDGIVILFIPDVVGGGTTVESSTAVASASTATASRNLTRGRVAGVSSASAFTAAAVVTRLTEAVTAISSSSSFTATSEVTGVAQGVANISSASTVTVSGVRTLSRVASVASASTLTATRDRIVNRAAATVSASTVTVTGAVTGPVLSVVQYYYLNSLVSHETGDWTTSTQLPNWMDRLAIAAGNTYSVDSEFGFLPQWTAPPRASMGYPEADSAGVVANTWTGAAAINRLSFVPDNFDGQAFDPDANTNLLTSTTYEDGILALIDAWEANAANAGRVYSIYSGWPEMALYGDPATITPTNLLAWQTYGLGAYQDWMELLVSRLQTARPTLDIRLSDINRVLLLTYQNTVVSSIATGDLFEDDAPHGRSSWYFLASLVEYMEAYGVKPPAGYVPDAGFAVNSTITSNYQDIVDYMWDLLQGAVPTVTISGESTFTATATRTVQVAFVITPSTFMEGLPATIRNRAASSTSNSTVTLSGAITRLRAATSLSSSAVTVLRGIQKIRSASILSASSFSATYTLETITERIAAVAGTSTFAGTYTVTRARSTEVNSLSTLTSTANFIFNQDVGIASLSSLGAIPQVFRLPVQVPSRTAFVFSESREVFVAGERERKTVVPSTAFVFSESREVFVAGERERKTVVPSEDRKIIIGGYRR